MLWKQSNQRGFTLIELVIIIVVLGILAAVAIPKYQNLSDEAREAATRGALGGLRSGVTIYYANQAVTTGTARWPSPADLRTVGTVMEQMIPKNPYQAENLAPDSICTGSIKGQIDPGGRGGWVYDSTTGQVWANTSTAGVNENSW